MDGGYWDPVPSLLVIKNQKKDRIFSMVMDETLRHSLGSCLVY